MVDKLPHKGEDFGIIGGGGKHQLAVTEGVLNGFFKFYNMEVQVDNNLETSHKGLYIIGDGSGITHSLSHASASGVFVARKIAEKIKKST